jgi:hypothetical protein
LQHNTKFPIHRGGLPQTGPAQSQIFIAGKRMGNLKFEIGNLRLKMGNYEESHRENIPVVRLVRGEMRFFSG